MFNGQRYTFKGSIIFIFTLKEHKRIHSSIPINLLKTVSLCIHVSCCKVVNCTARDCCLSDKAKFTVWSIIKLVVSLLMRHLVIGQRQKAPNFSAFHWSPHGCLITIGQHFVTTRVVHLPKRTETSLITESDQSRANHQLL